MAKNYIQPGHTITVAAPTGGALSWGASGFVETFGCG